MENEGIFQLAMLGDLRGVIFPTIMEMNKNLKPSRPRPV